MKFMISQEHMIIMHWFCLAVLFVTIVTMMVMNQYSYLLIYNEQQRVKETSAELSLTDPLTKIANRRGLNLLLKEKIFEYSELNKPFVLCYFDLNGFKEINDTFGHLTGDILLQTVTKRLSNVLRDSDCIARQGGDEFIIFMDTATNSKTFIERTAKRFLRVIQEDIILEDKRIINVGASLGFAVFPEHGDTIDKILSSADDAMYIAKKDDSIDWKLYSFQVE